jgi:Lsr2
MARTVRVHLIDDLDESEAAETVVFAVDGADYEIDLNAAHAEDLRRVAAPYIVAGRRVPRGAAVGARSARRSGVPASGNNRNQSIREWAGRTGIQVSPRGRIPADVIERFEKDATG